MSAETNKAIVRRLIEEVYNHKHLATVDELIAPNFVNHNTVSLEAFGPNGVKRAAMAQFAAFRDLHTTLEDVIAEGDKVVVRGTDSFIHQPDGKAVKITWIEIFRMENGKAVEAWAETDSRLFLEQLRDATK